MTLIYHNSALKYIKKQNPMVRMRIYEALEGLKEVPPKGDIKKLKDKNKFFRLRIGSIRIIYEPDYNERIVYIRTIDNRGDIY